MIGAVPVGAAVWLLSRLAYGVTTALAIFLVGAIIYFLVGPPPLGSRPGSVIHSDSEKKIPIQEIQNNQIGPG
jgi:hypothetical protein